MKLQKEIDLSWIYLYEQYKKDYFDKSKFPFAESNLLFIKTYTCNILIAQDIISSKEADNIINMNNYMAIPIIDSYINEIKMK